jgi:hypothetical protein
MVALWAVQASLRSWTPKLGFPEVRASMIALETKLGLNRGGPDRLGLDLAQGSHHATRADCGARLRRPSRDKNGDLGDAEIGKVIHISG